MHAHALFHIRNRLKPGRPCATTPVQLLYVRNAERLNIVAKNTIKRSALPVIRDESHGIIPAVDPRLGLGDYPDRVFPGQTSVKFILRIKVLHAPDDRVFGLHDFYSERSVWIMLPFARSGVRAEPNPPSQIGELRPFVVPGTAGKMHQGHYFAVFDEAAQIIPRILPWPFGLPILKMQQDQIIMIDGRGIEKGWIFGDKHLHSTVFLQGFFQKRRRLFPKMAGIVDASQ